MKKIKIITMIFALVCVLSIANVAFAEEVTQINTPANYGYNKWGNGNWETLQTLGSNSGQTWFVQQYLNYRYRNIGFGDLALDGQYGNTTKQRVRDFQSQSNVASDGIIGPTTWGKIHDRISQVTRGSGEIRYGARRWDNYLGRTTSELLGANIACTDYKTNGNSYAQYQPYYRNMNNNTIICKIS